MTALFFDKLHRLVGKQYDRAVRAIEDVRQAVAQFEEQAERLRQALDSKNGATRDVRKLAKNRAAPAEITKYRRRGRQILQAPAPSEAKPVEAGAGAGRVRPGVKKAIIAQIADKYLTVAGLARATGFSEAQVRSSLGAKAMRACLDGQRNQDGAMEYKYVDAR